MKGHTKPGRPGGNAQADIHCYCMDRPRIQPLDDAAPAIVWRVKMQSPLTDGGVVKVQLYCSVAR